RLLSISFSSLLVGTRSTASPFGVDTRDAVERVPTRVMFPMRVKKKSRRPTMRLQMECNRGRGRPRSGLAAPKWTREINSAISFIGVTRFLPRGASEDDEVHISLPAPRQAGDKPDGRGAGTASPPALLAFSITIRLGSDRHPIGASSYRPKVGLRF